MKEAKSALLTGQSVHTQFAIIAKFAKLYNYIVDSCCISGDCGWRGRRDEDEM